MAATVGGVALAVACCAALPLLVGSGALAISGAALGNLALIGAGLLLAGGTTWALLARRDANTDNPACRRPEDPEARQAPDRATTAD